METMELLPTLTENGWLSNPIQIIERIFVYYISTNSAKVVLYSEDDRPSIKRVMVKTANDEEEIASYIRSDLQTILDAYFPKVTVNTDITVEGNITKITIGIDVVDLNNITYKLEKSVDFIENEISNYQELLEEKMKLKIKDRNAETNFRF